MKVRLGHVSNSSSTSFSVPSFLLTDEQKEMLLSLDYAKETKAKLQSWSKNSKYDWEDSKNNYPRNDEYHKIYEAMVEKNEWHDCDWDIGENKKRKLINGSTDMWNGTIEKFMEKIGIDPTMVEIINHGHIMVHMAQHPEAVKHFIWLHEQWLKWWEEQNEEIKKMEIEFGHGPYLETPYAMSDDRFKPLGETTLQYESEEENETEYCFVKDKKK